MKSVIWNILKVFLNECSPSGRVGGGGEASKAAFNSGSEPKARLPVTTILNYPLCIGTARWKTSDVTPFFTRRLFVYLIKPS